MNLPDKEAILLLEDGTFYKGKAIGVISTTGGEICFNTGLTGYQEIYTDPSYFGQIIINTLPHIGNYGATDVEQESSSPKFAGLVCKSFSQLYSREKSQYSLQAYFEKWGIVGIEGVDTRMLVRYIRSKGAMNAIISSEILDVEELKKKLKAVPSMEGLKLSDSVSTKSAYEIGSPNAKNKVAVLDMGIKQSILNNFVERDCLCKVFPAKTSYKEMKAWGANGFFISNGPGDPSVETDAVATVKEILADNQPIFGICLGQQLLALANGVSTYKMHHGHRGLNHPVKNLVTGKSEITSQNHGFSVSHEDIAKNPNIEITHINLNDQTIEGIRIKGKKAFSVQYHPESSPGPHDSRYLFDDFIQLFQN